jgi:hypothetical protein
MKNTIHFLSLFLAAALLFSCSKEEDDGGDDDIPPIMQTAVRITKITLNSFNGTNASGQSWDNNPITGNYLPDVYPIITDVSGTHLYHTGTSNRKENASPTGSYVWNIDYYHNDLSKTIYVDLFDYDDTSTDEYMGYAGGWAFTNISITKNSTTVVTSGVSVTLHWTWI